MLTITTHNPEQTQTIGRQLASYLLPGDIIPLTGDMGSGKTCFVQGVAEGLSVPGHLTVSSPSFTLVNRYPGRLPLYHVDLYRLDSTGELDDIELNEIIHGRGVTFIEWPQLILPQLSHVNLIIDFLWEMTSEFQRKISFHTNNQRFTPFIKELADAHSGD